MESIERSGIFDADWYLESYPDVDISGVNPLWHFATFGGKEGRNPGPNFDTRRYLSDHPEATSLGLDAVSHFLAASSTQRGNGSS